MTDSSSPLPHTSENSKESDSSEGLPRRRFLKRAGQGMSALFVCGTSAGSGCTIPVRSFRAPSGESIVKIPLSKFPELERPEGRLKVKAIPGYGVVFVSRSLDGGYLGVSGVCTHRGCIIRPSGKGYRCPCHGSTFTQDGDNIRGPATRPLALFEVVRRGEEIVLKLGD